MSIFKPSVRLCSQRVYVLYTERLKIFRVLTVMMILHNIPIALYENIIQAFTVYIVDEYKRLLAK